MGAIMNAKIKCAIGMVFGNQGLGKGVNVKNCDDITFLRVGRKAKSVLHSNQQDILPQCPSTAWST